MKCLISDFDGTLYDDNFIKNIDSIKEFVSKGNIFIINTGRTYLSIKKAISDYNIPYKYLICGDGATIYDNKDNQIYSKFMNDNLKYELIKELEKYKLVFDDNYTLIEDYNQNISRMFIKRNNTKIDNKIVNDLNKKFNVKSYLSTNWINISDKNINKLTAIKYLVDLEKINNIYSVGNSINDVEMLLGYNGYLMKLNDVEENYNLPIISSVEELIKNIKDT